MFSSSINPSGAHYGPPPSQEQIELQEQALQEQVQQMRGEIEQVCEQIDEPIRKQIREAWNDFHPERQQMPRTPGIYGLQQGMQAMRQVAQQLRPILQEAVGPMGPVMREIRR
ncbi:MAG: hypothetical protein LBF94_00560 [Puniceicoccales bacterium]|nr:hypothetical protein [Puniceicoccales bacterium]